MCDMTSPPVSVSGRTLRTKCQSRHASHWLQRKVHGAYEASRSCQGFICGEEAVQKPPLAVWSWDLELGFGDACLKQLSSQWDAAIQYMQATPNAKNNPASLEPS